MGRVSRGCGLIGWVLIGVLTHMENSYFAQSLVFVAFCIFFVCCLFSGNYAHQSRRCSVYLAAKTQYWTQQNVHFQLHQWADPARCKWSLIRHKQLLVALHLCFHVCTPYIPGSFLSQYIACFWLAVHFLDIVPWASPCLQEMGNGLVNTLYSVCNSGK